MKRCTLTLSTWLDSKVNECLATKIGNVEIDSKFCALCKHYKQDV